jgi:hypothetical protein
MSAYLKSEDRYHSDPRYRTIVDVLTHALLSLELTPTEMREMAAYACIRFEQHRLRPTIIPSKVADEIRGNIDQLRGWLDSMVPHVEGALADGTAFGRGIARPARLDTDGKATGKTILTAPIHAGREGTMSEEPGAFHIDTETGERNQLR